MSWQMPDQFSNIRLAKLIAASLFAFPVKANLSSDTWNQIVKKIKWVSKKNYFFAHRIRVFCVTFCQEWNIASCQILQCRNFYFIFKLFRNLRMKSRLRKIVSCFIFHHFQKCLGMHMLIICGWNLWQKVSITQIKFHALYYFFSETDQFFQKLKNIFLKGTPGKMAVGQEFVIVISVFLLLQTSFSSAQNGVRGKKERRQGFPKVALISDF